MKILTVITLFLLIGASSGYCCSCDGESTVKDALEYSDIVFRGKVISRTVTADYSKYGIKFKANALPIQQNPKVAIYQIAVQKVYKGNKVVATVTMMTASNPAACGYPFSVGETYLVYGIKKDETFLMNISATSTIENAYWTNHCMRNTSFFEIEEYDIKKIQGSTSSVEHRSSLTCQGNEIAQKKAAPNKGCGPCE